MASREIATVAEESFVDLATTPTFFTPVFSPDYTIAGGLSNELQGERRIGTLPDGRKIDWNAYGNGIRALYERPHGRALTEEAYPAALQELNSRFGLSGGEEQAPDSVGNGGIAAAGIEAVNSLVGSGGDGGDGCDGVAFVYPDGARGRRNPSRWYKRVASLVIASMLLGACQPLGASSSSSPPTEKPAITQPVPPGFTTEVAADRYLLDEGLEHGPQLHDWLGANGVADNCVIADDPNDPADRYDRFVAEGGLPQIDALAGLALDAIEHHGVPEGVASLECVVGSPDNPDSRQVSFYFAPPAPADTVFVPTQSGTFHPALIDQEGHISALVSGQEESVASSNGTFPAVVRAEDCYEYSEATGSNLAGVLDSSGPDVDNDPRSFIDVDQQSIVASLRAQGIDPSGVDIVPLCWSASTTSPHENMRWGQLVFANPEHTAVWVTQSPEGEPFWRPDLRPEGGFVWVLVEKPEGAEGEIKGDFPPGEENPAVLLVDTQQVTKSGYPVIARLEQGTWFTPDGKVFVSPTEVPTAEPTPTSCLDLTAESRVVEQGVRESGFATIDDMMNDFIDRYGLRSNLERFGLGALEWATEIGKQHAYRVGIKYALLLGHFEIKVDEGHANCVVFAYPVMNTDMTLDVRVVSAVTDATINGKWSGVYIIDKETNGNIFDFKNEKDMYAWIDTRIGQLVKVQVNTGNDPESLEASATFKDRYYPRSVIKPLALNSYVARLGESDIAAMGELVSTPSLPDPSELADGLRQQIEEDKIPNEPGLFVDNITG